LLGLWFGAAALWACQRATAGGWDVQVCRLSCPAGTLPSPVAGASVLFPLCFSCSAGPCPSALRGTSCRPAHGHC